MNIQIAIPSALSSLRVIALPIFLYFFTLGNMAACLITLIYCALTDYLDGYIARKLYSTSRFGAFYDAGTDFFFIIGTYTIFFMQDFFPAWLLLLIIISFLQFIITSHYAKKLFDPIGRYLGSALYIGIALTLLWPNQFVFDFVQYAFLIFFLTSIASRVLSLTKRQN